MNSTCKDVEEDQCWTEEDMKFCPRCIIEIQKHNYTKAALDRAIQLSNMLMGEIYKIEEKNV